MTRAESSPVPMDPVFVNDIKILKESGVSRERLATSVRAFIQEASEQDLIAKGSENRLFNRLMEVYDDFKPNLTGKKPIKKAMPMTAGPAVVVASLMEQMPAAEQAELRDQVIEAYRTGGGEDGEGWVRLPPKIQKMLNEYTGEPDDTVTLVRITDPPQRSGHLGRMMLEISGLRNEGVVEKAK